MLEIDLHPSDRRLRQFAGLVLPAVAVTAAVLLVWRFQHPVWAIVILLSMVLCTAAGLTRPALLRPAYVVWMMAAYPIGWLLAHVALSAAFWLVVTPTAILLRLLQRDPLQRQRDTDVSTYWQPYRGVEERSRWFRQF